MTTITVMKDDCGKLGGFTERDQKSYRRFRKVVEALEPGELFTLEYWFPRDSSRHRKHMGLIRSLYNAQERFDDETQFRKYLELGAGFCDWIPGPKGGIVPVPKSIAYHKIDDADLDDLHEKTKAFVRGERAQKILWPHLSPSQSADMVATLLAEFEQ